MPRKRNTDLTPLARQMRQEMTPQERKLWYEFLNDYPVRFVRQKVLGRYVADFYCAGAKLVIELDGSQHYMGEEKEKDTARTEFLEREYGVTVLRFTNLEVNRYFQAVCDRIEWVVGERMREREKEKGESGKPGV